jgi:hypothetical protein
MVQQIVIPSPNKKYKAVLKSLGEVLPGNSYFSLSIDGFESLFRDRVFGHVCLWSPESQFLAVQEWKDTKDASMPKSYLLLIVDLAARRECVVASMDRTKGKIIPQGFIGESLMYTVIYEGQFGITRNFESKFHYLDGWQVIK